MVMLRISLTRDQFYQLVCGKIVKIEVEESGKTPEIEICLQDIGFSEIKKLTLLGEIGKG